MQNSHGTKLNTKENEDGDYRKSPTKVISRTTNVNLGKTRTNTSLKIDHSKDKELISSGLRKLVSTFNTAKISQKASKLATNRQNDKLLSPPIRNSIPEKVTTSHIVLTKQISIDKYTMTDFEGNERKIDLESSVLNSQPSYNFQGKELQWTDPRLLKKYAMLKQPFKKSLTVPYGRKEYDSDAEVVEKEEEEKETELVYSKHTHYFFKCLYYFCTASVSFLGSMCGLALITLILTIILKDNMFNFQLEPPRHDLFFTRHFTNFVQGIFYLISAFLGKIGRLLTISTSEVFAKDEGARWYENYLKY